jgi:hypothetical protein
MASPPVLWLIPNAVVGRATDETSKSTANLVIVLRIVSFKSTMPGERLIGLGLLGGVARRGEWISQ